MGAKKEEEISVPFVKEMAGFFGRVASTFVGFALHETEVLHQELSKIDKKMQAKEMGKEEAKKEFNKLIARLDVVLSRLIDKGEKFEAQHLYHQFAKFIHLFGDKDLEKKFKKLHP